MKANKLTFASVRVTSSSSLFSQKKKVLWINLEVLVGYESKIKMKNASFDRSPRTVCSLTRHARHAQCQGSRSRSRSRSCSHLRLQPPTSTKRKERDFFPSSSSSSAYEGGREREESSAGGSSDACASNSKQTTRRVSAAAITAAMSLLANGSGAKAAAKVSSGNERERERGSKLTVASLSSGSAVAKATTKSATSSLTRQIEGVGLLSLIAAAISMRQDLKISSPLAAPVGMSSKGEEKKRTKSTRVKAVLNDSTDSAPAGDSLESLSAAAAAAAAEAAKAAGQATAIASMTKAMENERGEEGGDTVALDEVKSCVSAALESSSEQTKLAVLDIAETLLKRLEMKDEEIEKLQGKIVTSNEVTQSVQEIRESTNKKLSDLFGDMEKLRAKLQDIVVERDGLRQRVTTLQVAEGQVAALQSKLEGEEGSRAEMEAKMTAMQEKLQASGQSESLVESLKRDLETASSESKDLRERLSNLEVAEGEVFALQTKLEGEEANRAELEAEMKSIQEKLQASEQSEALVESLRSQLIESENNAIQLTEDLKKQTMQVDELRGSNESLQASVSALEGDLSSLKLSSEDSARLLEENKSLSELVQKMESEVAQTSALEEEVASMQEKIDSLQVKADKGHELLFKSNKSNTTLKEGMSSLEEEGERLKNQLDEEQQLSRERQDLLIAKEQELEKALGVVSDLKNHLSETHERNKDLENTCTLMKSNLEASNDSLDKELKEREREVFEMNQLLKRLKDSSDQVDSLKAQLIQVQADYSSQQTMALNQKQNESEMKAEIDRLKTELESRETSGGHEMIEVLNDLNDMKGQLSQSRLDNELKETTIERLTLKLTESENLVQGLEERSSGLQRSKTEYEQVISGLETKIEQLDARLEEDSEKMNELNELRTELATYSSEAGQAQNLREFINEQKNQFLEKEQALKDEVNAKEQNARILTSLIQEIHMLVSRLE